MFISKNKENTETDWSANVQPKRINIDISVNIFSTEKYKEKNKLTSEFN